MASKNKQKSPLNARLGCAARNICTYLLMLSITVSASYQQQRFFSLERTMGLNDTRSYVEMAKGNYNISPVHNKRFVLPTGVHLLRPIILPIHQKFAENVGTISEKEAENSSYIFTFWLLNSIIIASCGYLLFLSLKDLSFSPPFSLIGSILFLTSRTSIYTAGTPQIDSLYFLAIAFFCYSIISKNSFLYIAACMLCAVSKENAILLPFLPLVCGHKYRKPLYFLSGILTVGAFLGIRQFVLQSFISISYSGQDTSLFNIFVNHLYGSYKSIQHFISPTGVYDMLHGFGLLALISVFGYAINKRKNLIKIPAPVLMIIPLSIFFALLSGNLGRMFFASYVPVTAYSLIGLELITKPISKKTNL